MEESLVISTYNEQAIQATLQECGIPDIRLVERQIVDARTRNWWAEAHAARTAYHHQYGRGYCHLCVIHVTLD